MIIMKWEIQSYAGLSFLIIILLIYQSNLIRIENNEPISEVRNIDSFKQLLVDLECNIYLLEGETQNILVEGPSNKLKNIETIYNEGCFTIKENGGKLLSKFFSIINKNKNQINIYITINNLNNFLINPSDEQSIFRYIADDMIGLSLKYGNYLILESRKTKNCG